VGGKSKMKKPLKKKKKLLRERIMVTLANYLEGVGTEHVLIGETLKGTRLWKWTSYASLYGA